MNRLSLRIGLVLVLLAPNLRAEDCSPSLAKSSYFESLGVLEEALDLFDSGQGSKAAARLETSGEYPELRGEDEATGERILALAELLDCRSQARMDRAILPRAPAYRFVLEALRKYSARVEYRASLAAMKDRRSSSSWMQTPEASPSLPSVPDALKSLGAKFRESIRRARHGAFRAPTRSPAPQEVCLPWVSLDPRVEKEIAGPFRETLALQLAGRESEARALLPEIARSLAEFSPEPFRLVARKPWRVSRQWRYFEALFTLADVLLCQTQNLDSGTRSRLEPIHTWLEAQILKAKRSLRAGLAYLENSERDPKLRGPRRHEVSSQEGFALPPRLKTHLETLEARFVAPKAASKQDPEIQKILHTIQEMRKLPGEKKVLKVEPEPGTKQIGYEIHLFK